MNSEIEAASINQLHDLATEAVEKNLITAHGYRGSQYEILRQGEFVYFSPAAAIQFLQTLLRQIEL
ncbi:MAG: hypothetical protein ACFB2W_00360 [Leptolyngbyaceae cyanobacterium]